MALALSPQHAPRSPRPAVESIRPKSSGRVGAGSAGVRLSTECRTRRNLDAIARHHAAQRQRMRAVYLRRRIVAGMVLVTIAAAACLGVRAMASRGDGAASLPTVTPQASTVLFAAIDPSGTNQSTADLTGAFARSEQMYVVQPGDTLWSIASSLTQGSIRSYVSDLIELNGSASIEVGQRLALPSD